MKHISSEYYRAGSTYLSKEAINEIKSFTGKGPNIIYTMARKYQISPFHVKKYMKNRERKQQVVTSSILSHQNSNDFWNKEIEEIYALYKYYSANARYLSNEAIREIKGSMGRVPDAINAMAKKYRINHYRVLDYIENRERKQQIIQSTISSEILPIPTILPEKSNQIESEVLHLESTTFPNKEIKKRSFKSNSKPRTKSIRISNPISNMVASTLSET
ncbi:hypothetical protein Glove_198g89 [Diversispora epigaea]|uniref:Uncharacterized protein n=1 Tax=Diversispora epigaea TaxID=1348612 RepID=A0A397ITR7_9GLOM|nr:hypothetical protein Glove_198g89 [Diversispora epigaea]